MAQAGRYKPYPAYQPSGVEWSQEFPKTWKATRFKNLFSIKKRIAGRLGLDVLSITQKGIKVKDLESGEGQLAMDYSNYQHVHTGDFAMNHMDLLTGYVDISKYDGVTSPDYRVFSLKLEGCHPAFYLYILQHCYHAKIFFPLGQGAAHLGRWRLPTEAFNMFVAPVPTQQEQSKIAAFLDHETTQIDELIAKQQTLITLLEEKRQAVISHAVTKGLNPNAPLRPSGIDWLGDVPAHWAVSKVKHAFDNLDSIRVPLSSLERSDMKRNFPYYGASGVIDYVDGYLFDEPLVLVSEDGANLLARSTPIAFSASGQYWVNNHAHILRPMDHNVEFWSEAVERNDLTPFVTGSAQPKFTSEALSNLPIVFPASQNERDELNQYLSEQKQKYSHMLQKSQSAISLLKESRMALISAAVTGKIDVREWKPPQEFSDQNINRDATA